MAWCEANSVDYILGLPGNAVLDRLVEPLADDVRVRWAEREAPVVRRYVETSYGAKSWRCQRRVTARIKGSAKALDIRYVVTNIRRGRGKESCERRGLRTSGWIVSDACGSLDVPATRSILAAQHQGPEQAAPSLPTTAPAARTYDIDYRHPLQAGVSTDLRG
jgi:hypothetical protein